MSIINPTEPTEKNTLFKQTNITTTQNQSTDLSPSNPQPNLFPSSKLQHDNPKASDLNKQQKKEKQLRSDETQNKNKKEEGGGILRRGGKNQQKLENLAIDTTLHFSLQDIIESIVKGQKLDGRQIEKIVKNFQKYVRISPKPFSLDSICQEIKTSQQVKQKMLKLPYLNQIEEKSKKAINLFWCTMIQSISKKVPFLSEKSCLEIIKLEISMNKHNYCQKENLGTFNVQLFTDPHLFPIVNNKVQLNNQHKTFLTIQNRIIHLIHSQFKSLKVIFKQMSYLKINQNDKYIKVFGIFQEKQDTKKQVVSNLFECFFSMLKFTPQHQLSSNLSYFECIAESIWDFYLGYQSAFGADLCKQFLTKLNENYSFFNQSGRIVSLNISKLLCFVEKITISFLLSAPFTYKSWENKQMKNLILESHLKMLQPFKMLLPQNKREEFKIKMINFETSGLHWKEFIEIMIKIEQDDNERVDYILESMRVFFRKNYEDFWENPQKYESFYRFTFRVMSRKSIQFDERESRKRFLSILGIGSELMGLERQEEASMIDSREFGVEYPQRKIRPYGLQVHNKFSNYFLRMSQREFMEIIGGDVEKIIVEMKENQVDGGINHFRSKLLLKEYLLNLLCSEPCLFFEMCKTIPSIINRQQLLKFLIMDTIIDNNLPATIIDTTFAALDRMLTEPSTAKLIEYTLALDNQSQFNKFYLIDRLFQNVKALPFIARHCDLLILLGYHQQQWTKSLLNKFYELSIQQDKNLFSMNYRFASSYYKLLSGVLNQIDTKQENSQISFIKPYINLSFIINSLQYYLKFDLHRGDYINITICEQNPVKIESFIECLRLYDIILLNQLKIVNTKSKEESHFDSVARDSSFSRKQTQLLTLYEAKKFGIQDDEYYLQVKSLRNLTTSYLNALSFVLIGSSNEQKKLLKQINHNYEDLIFEAIQALTKLNGKTKLKDHFYVKNTYQTQIPSNINQWKPDDDLCLKKFISYVESTLNISGIQIIVFAELIQNPQKLRTLIDQLRTKMENPRVSERTSSKLALKAISTLSRYFRDFMARMSLKKDREINFDRLQIRDHVEYLLETIVKFVVTLKASKKSWEWEMINKILSNVYGGILIVQRLKGSQFLRLLKNYHPLLLNSINISYLENTRPVNKIELHNSRELTLSEQYFKLLQMFLNCEEYLSERQFNIIIGIKGLSEKVSALIFSIANYTEFSKLPQYFVDILVQIMISAVGFFIRICTEQQQKRDSVSRFYDMVREIKEQVNPSANLILLEVLIQNELSQCYNYSQLNMERQQLLALQMNSVGPELPIRIVEEITKKLAKSNLTNLAFLSIATGIFSNVEKSQDSTLLLKQLLNVYNQLLKFPPYLSQSLSYHSVQSLQNTSSKPRISNSPYKKVWTLELILAILTNIQTTPTPQKTLNLKLFQTLIIQNDGLLKRFGYLMKKIGFQQSQTYLPWLVFLQEEIANQLTNNSQLTFSEKLELYQIIKIFSFSFANTEWRQAITDKYINLIWVLLQYREVFQKLLFSTKKQRIQTPQQKVLAEISISSFSSSQLMTSGLKQFERQKISGNGLKSANSFELLHEVLNLDLSVQYALMCASIGVPFCQGLSKRVPQMADISKWNTLFLELSNAFVQKYIQLLANTTMLENILNGFQKIYSGNSQFNISLSKQMLFTNSPSLSCSLDVSYHSWKQGLIGTLKLLFEHIRMINKRLQTELHSDFKTHQQSFNKIILQLKDKDKQNFDYALYDRCEHKSKLSQTFKSNISMSVLNSQINQAYSGTIRNF